MLTELLSDINYYCLFFYIGLICLIILRDWITLALCNNITIDNKSNNKYSVPVVQKC